VASTAGDPGRLEEAMRSLLSVVLLSIACRGQHPPAGDLALSGTARFASPEAAGPSVPRGQKMRVFVTFHGTGTYVGRDVSCPGSIYAGEFKGQGDAQVALDENGAWQLDLPRRASKFTTVDGCGTSGVEIDRIDSFDVRAAMKPGPSTCAAYARAKGGSQAQINWTRDACARPGTSSIAGHQRAIPAPNAAPGELRVQLALDHLERADGSVIEEERTSM
jgi:hypothetical protein